MPFAKGKSGNISGRPPGTVNQRSKEWDLLKDCILSTHTKRFNELLEGLKDEAFIAVYLKVLQYFKPRMQHTKFEEATTINEPIKLTPEQIDKLVNAL